MLPGSKNGLPRLVAAPTEQEDHLFGNEHHATTEAITQELEAENVADKSYIMVVNSKRNVQCVWRAHLVCNIAWMDELHSDRRTKTELLHSMLLWRSWSMQMLGDKGK